MSSSCRSGASSESAAWTGGAGQVQPVSCVQNSGQRAFHIAKDIKEGDWVIELGPEGGEAGGKVVFEGTSDKLKKAKTWTGKYLR